MILPDIDPRYIPKSDLLRAAMKYLTNRHVDLLGGIEPEVVIDIPSRGEKDRYRLVTEHGVYVVSIADYSPKDELAVGLDFKGERVHKFFSVHYGFLPTDIQQPVVQALELKPGLSLPDEATLAETYTRSSQDFIQLEVGTPRCRLISLLGLAGLAPVFFRSGDPEDYQLFYIFADAIAASES